MGCAQQSYFVFFFNDTATTEIYTLSLHDALPISDLGVGGVAEQALVHEREVGHVEEVLDDARAARAHQDRKSTRLNSSHSQISYAVFCLKKKKKTNTPQPPHRPALAHRGAQPPSP